MTWEMDKRQRYAQGSFHSMVVSKKGERVRDRKQRERESEGGRENLLQAGEISSFEIQLAQLDGGVEPQAVIVGILQCMEGYLKYLQ